MGTCHRTAGCRGFRSYSKGGDRIREIGKLLSDLSIALCSKSRLIVFEHSAIERSPRKRQRCTSNTAELHFTLSEFLPSFPHLRLHIQACPSIRSITRLGFFSLFCRRVICKEK